jgi:hypothetical protein
VAAVLLQAVAWGQIPGDLNGDGVLDASDIDLLVLVIDPVPVWFDLNQDGVVDFGDRQFWVHELKTTWIGDANLDGQFNSGDFVQVFAAGKYETIHFAGWVEGDWNGDMQFDSSDIVAAYVDGGYEQGPRLIRGDYNGNGLLDAGDLDIQAVAILTTDDPAYDLNNDRLVDYGDRQVWVHELKHTWMGDANLDLEFDSSDMVQVFAGGKYEMEETAGWQEGDWNGDLQFNSSDMVVALVDCGYEVCNCGGHHCLRPPVPEPDGWLLLSLAAVSLPTLRRRRTVSISERFGRVRSIRA